MRVFTLLKSCSKFLFHSSYKNLGMITELNFSVPNSLSNVYSGNISFPNKSERITIKNIKTKVNYNFYCLDLMLLFYKLFLLIKFNLSKEISK